MTAKFVPRELLDPIFAYFHPRRVILFRFKAQGTAGPDSDIDLLVELDDDFPPDGFSAKPLRRPGRDIANQWISFRIARPFWLRAPAPLFYGAVSQAPERLEIEAQALWDSVSTGKGCSV